MRFIYLLPLLLLAACQTTLTPSDTHVGSPAWMQWAEHEAGITDGHGHGPDWGSQEWCRAISYKVYGVRPAGPVACDEAWMHKIDAALRDRYKKE